MITGKIRAERAAIIEMEVIGLNQRAKIEAILDTGFTSHLTLPGFLIDHLKLPRIGTRRTIIAHGRAVFLNLYLAKVIWHGRERNIEVLQTDKQPLVGMALLRGSRLTLDVVPDGDVTITALP
ncbi:MAG: hypothetical protein OXD49_09275 [Candidatus Poribacteria bacterium]|nr:hypothetical protein [Candidatus Poribacteria bacterium]